MMRSGTSCGVLQQFFGSPSITYERIKFSNAPLKSSSQPLYYHHHHIDIFTTRTIIADLMVGSEEFFKNYRKINQKKNGCFEGESRYLTVTRTEVTKWGSKYCDNPCPAPQLFCTLCQSLPTSTPDHYSHPPDRRYSSLSLTLVLTAILTLT